MLADRLTLSRQSPLSTGVGTFRTRVLPRGCRRRFGSASVPRRLDGASLASAPCRSAIPPLSLRSGGSSLSRPHVPFDLQSKTPPLACSLARRGLVGLARPVASPSPPHDTPRGIARRDRGWLPRFRRQPHHDTARPRPAHRRRQPRREARMRAGLITCLFLLSSFEEAVAQGIQDDPRCRRLVLPTVGPRGVRLHRS